MILKTLPIFVLAVSGIWAIGVPSSGRRPTTTNPSFLDAHRQRYLSLELALWHVIDSDLENSYKLQQVHSGHRTFLTENFQDKSAYLSLYDPDHRQIFDAINRINVSVSDTVGSYLRTSTQYYNEKDAMTISRLNQNLTYQLDLIYNVTGETDFYKVLRNVSKKRLCFRLLLFRKLSGKTSWRWAM